MLHDLLQRPLPEELKDLTDLALDLRWTGSELAGRIWKRLDEEAWERTRNPYMILLNAHRDRLEAAARDQRLLRELADWLARRREYQESPGWFGEHHGGSSLKTIAYFSMEFGLSEALPIYSGGLGILAGDHLKSASDLGVPIIGIGLLYQQGYFRQVLDADGSQLEAFPYNDPSTLPISPVRGPDGRWPRVRLELPGRTLLIRVWQARVGKVTLYLLDSNDPLNSPWDRGITANLYAAGKEKRLLQELVLGIGGWQLLEMLGIDVQVCHLNEGHAAFAVLARAHSFARKNNVPFEVGLWATRGGNVFTTHTPVAAAFDQFDPALLWRFGHGFVQQAGLQMQQVLALGRRDPFNQDEPFNMAYLAMRGCAFANGVSRLHGRVSRQLFKVLFPRWPEKQIPVGHVTNGVHVPSWDSAPASNLWSQALGQASWLGRLEEAAGRLEALSPVCLWEFRAVCRDALVQYVRRRLVRQLRVRGASADQIERASRVLDPNFLTLGFARRFTAYKRPTLLFHDPQRLARILLNPERPVQLIMAGKAHPNDTEGKSMVRTVARFAFESDLRDRVVFLEDYDITLAQQFAAGIDVWINTPRRPAEACGTSGMKMLFNGGLNLSELDGWWDEGYTPQVGWALGDGQDHSGPEWDAFEANQLYEILERQVVPEFYDRDAEGVPQAWVRRIRASMARLTPVFDSARMVREYVEKAYLPAAAAYRRRSADGGRIARELHAWHEQLVEGWRGLRLGEVRITRDADQWQFDAQVYLGDVAPDLVSVELLADNDGDQPPTCIEMELKGPIPGAVNGHRYTARAPGNRPAEHYTIRIIPQHPDALVPMEDAHIFWQR